MVKSCAAHRCVFVCCSVRQYGTQARQAVPLLVMEFFNFPSIFHIHQEWESIDLTKCRTKCQGFFLNESQQIVFISWIAYSLLNAYYCHLLTPFKKIPYKLSININVFIVIYLCFVIAFCCLHHSVCVFVRIVIDIDKVRRMF